MEQVRNKKPVTAVIKRAIGTQNSELSVTLYIVKKDRIKTIKQVTEMLTLKLSSFIAYKIICADIARLCINIVKIIKLNILRYVRKVSLLKKLPIESKNATARNIRNIEETKTDLKNLNPVFKKSSYFSDLNNLISMGVTIGTYALSVRIIIAFAIDINIMYIPRNSGSVI